jgi:hypothetical protein
MPVEDDIGDSTPKSKTRKQISTRTRFEIFKRDGFTCQYCGATPPDVVLHVDHILAVSNGGTNDHGNLATSCSRCNFGKSAVPLESVPKTLGVQAKEAADRADQMKAYAELIQEARDADEDALWAVAEVIKPGASAGYSRDKCKGISNFIKKIGFAATLDAAHIASDRYGDGSRRFRYFCGICWNRVKEQSP